MRTGRTVWLRTALADVSLPYGAVWLSDGRILVAADEVQCYWAQRPGFALDELAALRQVEVHGPVMRADRRKVIGGFLRQGSDRRDTRRFEPRVSVEMPGSLSVVALGYRGKKKNPVPVSLKIERPNNSSASMLTAGWDFPWNISSSQLI